MEMMEAEYPPLVLPAMEMSAELSAVAYDALGDDFAELPELPGEGALRASVRWALTTGDATTGLSLLLDSTDRRVFSSARDTLVHNASREPGTKFGREYHGNGKCDFCPMLASRGAVYLSADTAGDAINFHDKCHCTIYVERP